MNSKAKHLLTFKEQIKALNSKITETQNFRTVNVPLMKGHVVSEKYRWDVLGKQKLLENIINLLPLNSGMGSPYSSKATILFIFIPLLFSGENEASSGTKNKLKDWLAGYGENKFKDEYSHTHISSHKAGNNDKPLSYMVENENHGSFIPTRVGEDNTEELNVLIKNFYNDYSNVYNSFVDAYSRFYERMNDFQDDMIALMLLDNANSWYDKLFSMTNYLNTEKRFKKENIREYSEQEESETTNKSNTLHPESGKTSEDRNKNNHAFWYQTWYLWNTSGISAKSIARDESKYNHELHHNDVNNNTFNSMLVDPLISVNVYGKDFNQTVSKSNFTGYFQDEYDDNVNIQNGTSLKVEITNSNRREEKIHDSDTITEEGTNYGIVPNGSHESTRFSQKYISFMDMKEKILRNIKNNANSENDFSVKRTGLSVNGKYRRNSTKNNGFRSDRHERLREKGINIGPNSLYEAKQIIKREVRNSGSHENVGNSPLEGDSDITDGLTERDRKRSRLKYRGVNKMDLKQRDEYLRKLSEIVKCKDDNPEYNRGNYKRNTPRNNGDTEKLYKYRKHNMPEEVTDENEENLGKYRLKGNENSERLKGGNSNSRRSEFSERKTSEGRPGSDSGGTLKPNDKEDSLQRRSDRRLPSDDDDTSLTDSTLSKKTWRQDSEKMYNNTELTDLWAHLRDKCNIDSMKDILKSCVSKVVDLFK